MKKALALILTVALMFTLLVSVNAEEATGAKCGMVSWEDRDQLPADKKEAFAAAKAALEDPLPVEYESVLFAFHFSDGDSNVLFYTDPNAEIVVTEGADEAYLTDAPVKKDAEIIVRQYADGEWVRKEADFDGSTILVKGMGQGPVSLYQWTPGNPIRTPKPVESPHVYPPELIFRGCDGCKIVSWRNRGILATSKKALFEEAKEQLKDAVPAGYVCRDIVYQDVNDGCAGCSVGMLMIGNDFMTEEEEAEWVHDMKALGACSGYRVTLSLGGVSDVSVKQYTNQKWVDKKITVESDSVLIDGVVDGPVAIFMK